MLCEIDPAARAVLRERFSNASLEVDVAELSDLGHADLVTAGFPCQDLTQVGRTAGITGQQSSLVHHVFRLLDESICRGSEPTWVLLENVPFMLRLARGAGMRYLVRELEQREYRWAYRIVDTRAFGLPQRRQRVILLASRLRDPRNPLLAQDVGEPPERDFTGLACGFYWTEGRRGLGWAVDAIPTLKGGSGLGIPSPPAIWMPNGSVVLPDVRDAERLQGFPSDWTVAAAGSREGHRWRLLGNAVSVPVAEWIGERLRPAQADDGALPSSTRLEPGEPWPVAASGGPDGRWRWESSAWPARLPTPPLAEFLEHPGRLLSRRATAGFLSRAKIAKLKFPPGFIDALETHLERVSAFAA